jgi:predicted nucleic acid-binding protein
LVWWATGTECLSAVARRERELVLTPADADDARKLLGMLNQSWNEILATETVRSHAARLLRRHPLRAADALQLAAALTWAQGRPTSHRVATFDPRLAAAARGEGFELALSP